MKFIDSGNQKRKRETCAHCKYYLYFYFYFYFFEMVIEKKY